MYKLSETMLIGACKSPDLPVSADYWHEVAQRVVAKVRDDIKHIPSGNTVPIFGVTVSRWEDDLFELQGEDTGSSEWAAEEIVRRFLGAGQEIADSTV